MPEHSGTILGKIADLQELSGGERRPAEVVAVYWPSGTRVYASAMYTEMNWWSTLADAIEAEFGDEIPLTLTLIPDGRTPFNDLPRTASVSDDSITLTFSDLDDAFSGLLMLHGEGCRIEVFGFWPAVDLFVSMWRGALHAPKDMSRGQVKVTATAGFRAQQMLVPRRPFAVSCPFIFGAYFATQAEITAAKGCPYNAHLTEEERGGAPLIGVPGFTDCPRRVKADCVERLATEDFWPGFETRADAIPNNQTQGPNLLAKAIGNESALSDPIRAVFGERYVKALYLLAFRNETDTNHPEDGFFAGLFAISEGPNLAQWEFRMMGQLVGAEHQSLRRGELGQLSSGWSPGVNSYSGTAHGYGRIQGESDDATAADYSASIRVLGLRDVRVYTDEDTYSENYTTNRMWALLEILANARWGYGQDYVRYLIESAIEVAAWCDEVVSLTDPNGNTFGGVRSTFNAEVTARAIQQQVKDICTAGRIGLPFEFNGKDVFVPLKVEDTDDPDIPTFTDEGTSRNIVYDREKSSLGWSYISDEEMVNQWTVNFDDASNGGVDTQLIFGDQPQQLRAGRAWGDRSKRVINKSQAAYGINNVDEAARFGLSLLYLGPLDSGGILNPWKVKFTTWYTHAFRVQNYKLIKVVNAKLQSLMAAYFAARDLSPYPGADFTAFRVMKYTRKGDLKVEIEAQMYATLEEAPLEIICEFADTAFTGSAAGSNTVARPLGVLEGDLMIAAVAVETPSFTEPSGWTLYAVDALGSYPGDYHQVRVYYKAAEASEPDDYSWVPFSGSARIVLSAYRGMEPGAPSGFDTEKAADADALAVPVETAPSVKSRLVLIVAEQSSLVTASGPTDWTARADSAGVQLYDREQGSVGSNAALAFSVSGKVIGFSLALSPDCTTPAADFSAPRNFTAAVNAVTGQVQFSWAPPARNPQLVTGFVLYASDAVTEVMLAELRYNFTLTLAPGEYGYHLRATDGTDFSAFVSVSFTVPTPPVTGTDLLVIDDLTYEQVYDDLTAETVTV